MTASDWGLQERGAALYDEFDGDDVPASRQSQVVEVARLVDRLEELNSVIAGKGVLNLMRFRLSESWGDEDDRTVLVRVQFDSVLAEARQSQLALERLMKSLTGGEVAVKAEVDLGDDLAKQRADRIARATG